jgi:hypothetical protein
VCSLFSRTYFDFESISEKIEKLSSFITDKEITYGQDREKEKNHSRKAEKGDRLYLFFMREGHKDPFSPMLARQDRTNLYMRILRRDDRRSPARVLAYGGQDEIFL